MPQEWNDRRQDFPLGELVRENRARLGLTQQEYADRIGISQAYVSSMERGSVKLPDVEIRRKLADTMGISHVDLLIACEELEPGEVKPGLVRPAISPVQQKIDALDPDSRRAIERIIDDVYVSRKREG